MAHDLLAAARTYHSVQLRQVYLRVLPSLLLRTQYRSELHRYKSVDLLRCLRALVEMNRKTLASLAASGGASGDVQHIETTRRLAERALFKVQPVLEGSDNNSVE